jgi:hypothetical protein
MSGACTGTNKNVNPVQLQRHDLTTARIDQRGWAVSDHGSSSDAPSISSINGIYPVKKDSKSAYSIFSYKSDRDRQEYLRLINGRYMSGSHHSIISDNVL